MGVFCVYGHNYGLCLYNGRGVGFTIEAGGILMEGGVTVGQRKMTRNLRLRENRHFRMIKKAHPARGLDGLPG